MQADTVDDLFRRFGPRYRWYVTLSGLVGGFSMVLSATIVNVAVPDVMGAFGVGQDRAQWMATAFLATMTASQLLNAWITEAFGQRLGFAITLMVFMAGAVMSATAASMDMLILGRVLQGVAAGIVMPMTMVTIFTVFPPERRGMAMGIYGAGLVLAPALGPAVGGVAIDTLSWRAMFLLPLPFCMIALLAGMVFMPSKGRIGRLPPFDWFGFLFLASGLFLLMTAAASGPREGWLSDRILLYAALGGVSVVAFVLIQLKSRAPLLDVTLFRRRAFTAAVIVAFVFGVGNFGSSYVIPVFVQQVQGFTATKAGLLLMPAGLLLFFALPLTGRAADRLPDHIPVLAGLAFFAFGTLLMATADANTGFWSFAVFAMISRVGMSFIMPSLSASALRALPDEKLARGSGAMNFIRQLGGASGTNLIVVWLQLRTHWHAESLAATQTAGNAASRGFLETVADRIGLAGLPDAERLGAALDYLGQVVHAQALAFGFRDCFLALGVVFLLAMLPALNLARLPRRE